MNSLRSPPPAKRLRRAEWGWGGKRGGGAPEGGVSVMRGKTLEMGEWDGSEEGSEETRRAIKMIKGTGRATVGTAEESD